MTGPQASPSERRDNDRLPLRAYAQVDGQPSLEAHVLDISLTGIRIALLQEHGISPGEPLELVIEPDMLPQALAPLLPLTLKAKVVHLRQHILGLTCEPMEAADAQRLETLIAQLTRTA
ncbi:PilZ domain-containing protein [Gilvimarinus algae]|uniref:PilZ domain-containing protein n=1 Tax=Gilvimarinus algae TaxID=3058037 RepID=A0ABT8T9Z2_9GAMM|nr:PilZ domain-containing protein [Gilvimarinus sp. SDUM040014]MDO3380944.1 PilZ domain-containing protein [Gilvimarinus sp. SDUM040014]